MKKLVVLSGIVAMVCGLSVTATAHEQESSHSEAKEKKAEVRKPVTQKLKGEILDLSCYLGRGAKGKKHQKCARNCIKKGGSVGFLSEDGTLYDILVDPHLDAQVFDDKDAGKPITVHGKVFKKHGLQILQIEKVERAETKDTSAPKKESTKSPMPMEGSH